MTVYYILTLLTFTPIIAAIILYKNKIAVNCIDIILFPGLIIGIYWFIMTAAIGVSVIDEYKKLGSITLLIQKIKEVLWAAG